MNSSRSRRHYSPSWVRPARVVVTSPALESTTSVLRGARRSAAGCQEPSSRDHPSLMGVIGVRHAPTLAPTHPLSTPWRSPQPARRLSRELIRPDRPSGLTSGPCHPRRGPAARDAVAWPTELVGRAQPASGEGRHEHLRRRRPMPSEACGRMSCSDVSSPRSRSAPPSSVEDLAVQEFVPRPLRHPDRADAVRHALSPGDQDVHLRAAWPRSPQACAACSHRSVLFRPTGHTAGRTTPRGRISPADSVGERARREADGPRPGHAQKSSRTYERSDVESRQICATVSGACMISPPREAGPALFSAAPSSAAWIASFSARDPVDRPLTSQASPPAFSGTLMS